MDLQIQLSPQLQQTIHAGAITQLNILQMSHQELLQHVTEQLDVNPFIEIEENVAYEQAVMKSNYKLSKMDDHMYASLLNGSTQSTTKMYEHIMEQLLVEAKGLKKEWPILLYLVEQLDHRLFLQVDRSKVAAKFQVDEAVIQRLIQLLQQLEPFGIAMENATAFLIAQAKRNPNAPPLTVPLINFHLEDLAKKKYRTLAKNYNCTVQEIEKTVQFIQTLSLYPLVEDDLDIAHHIMPDVLVEKVGDDWIIEMEQSIIPKVMLSDYYYQLLESKSDSNDEVTIALQDAALLIQGIEARQQTLYKVLERIVTHQRLFLERGLDFLRPLTLADVANMTNLHESTISRAIREKFIQTPLGTFPIRTLFSKGMKQCDGEATTVQSIKKKIAQLIMTEQAQHPLSDNQLVEALKKEGISISRRTVTKYREGLGIPNSYERIRADR